jgi:Na+/melibiose symporter-like transporter
LPSNRPTETSPGDSAPRAGRLPRVAGHRLTRLRLTSARVAAVIYTAASFLVALAFWLVTTLTGDFTNVARWGGAAWIFLLMMIVLMPLVIPWMKRRATAEEETACPLPSDPEQQS